jgi:hypothetical protein
MQPVLYSLIYLIKIITMIIIIKFITRFSDNGNFFRFIFVMGFRRRECFFGKLKKGKIGIDGRKDE